MLGIICINRIPLASTFLLLMCCSSLGHLDGIHAPGLKLGMSEVLLAGHNALRAHGKSVQVIRANAKAEPLVSMAQANKISIPASEHPNDIEAARQHMFSVREKHLFSNSWFTDPMIFGHYPEEGIRLFAADMPKIHSGDLECINQELDHFGTNIYSG